MRQADVNIIKRKKERKLSSSLKYVNLRLVVCLILISSMLKKYRHQKYEIAILIDMRYSTTNICGHNIKQWI